MSSLTQSMDARQRSFWPGAHAKYNLTISGCSGIDFIENGIWSLDKNLIDFNVRSSPTNSGAPLKWAFASSENGQISLIPDYFTGSYIDRGYSKALSYRRGVANASKIGEDQATD